MSAPDDAVAARIVEQTRRATDRAAALARDLADIVERSSDAVRDDEHDPEGATIAFERAQVAALLDAARRQLADLEVAGDRLRAGEHGVCEACGGDIGDERRLARPTARRCAGCAT